MIDERRARITQAIEEADNARVEARELLEQHRALIGQAKSESAEILAEARKVSEAQMARVREEAEVERQRRLEETRKQIDAETARAIDQIRTEVADLTLEATQRVVGKVLDTRRPAAADRRGDRRARLLGTRARPQLAAMAAAQRIYARALFEAAQDQKRVDDVDRDLGALRRGAGRDAGAAGIPRQPAARPGARRPTCSRSCTDGADELVSNFAAPARGEGQVGRDRRRSTRSSARSSTAPQGRIAVELTTAHELSDDEARAIVEKIEKASGRTVEATRTVDPDLIGGMILQAGSLRVDASVRGRLERLRRELVTR